MKLYAIASNDLTKPQQFVQATHAVAQYLIDNPDSKWKNQTLVMLKSGELNLIEKYFIDNEVKYSKFNEPYYDNKLTALSTDNDLTFFNDLKLI